MVLKCLFFDAVVEEWCLTQIVGRMPGTSDNAAFAIKKVNVLVERHTGIYTSWLDY